MKDTELRNVFTYEKVNELRIFCTDSLIRIAREKLNIFQAVHDKGYASIVAMQTLFDSCYCAMYQLENITTSEFLKSFINSRDSITAFLRKVKEFREFLTNMGESRTFVMNYFDNIEQDCKEYDEFIESLIDEHRNIITD